MSEYKETLAFIAIIVCIVVLAKPETVGQFWNELVAGFDQEVAE